MYEDQKVQRDTLLYLSGLQFMALSAPSAAALAFSHITPSMQDSMRSRFREPGAIPLDIIMDEIIRLLPLRPEHDHAGSPEHPPVGLLFFLLSRRKSIIQSCKPDGIKAFETLEARNCRDFSMQLAQCYCHVLNVVREFMVTCGLPEAAEIVTPEKRFLRCIIYK